VLCSVVQRGAVCCSMLQYVAVLCTVLQHVVFLTIATFCLRLRPFLFWSRLILCRRLVNLATSPVCAPCARRTCSIDYTYLHIYICIYLCIFIYICLNIYTYTNMYIFVYMNTCIHTHIYVYTCIHNNNHTAQTPIRFCFDSVGIFCSLEPQRAFQTTPK